MALYELQFSNNQLGDFNSTGFSGGLTGSQELTINSNHPGDRLVDNGAISDVSEITGWRLTVMGDESLDENGEPDDTGNDVVPGAPIGVEYSTDGGETWKSYTTDIGEPDAVYYARQDEENWMALTARIPGEDDGQYGFIVADNGVSPGQVFATDETVFETQTGEYALPCFTAGTKVMTSCGAVAVEDLAVDDLVLTRDSGMQPIRWIGRRTLSKSELERHPNLRPVRIKAGALGKDTPRTDLSVSQQHRILVRSNITENMLGICEVLVAAKHLCEISGIDIVDDASNVTYIHFLLDNHQVVFSNGAETESLYTGPEALKAVGAEAIKEIFSIFPELYERTPDDSPVGARPFLTGRQGRKLALRHQKNGKALVV